MRRIMVLVLLAVALLVSSFTLTSAQAARDNTFRVTSITKQTADIDVGPKGMSIGDYSVFSDDVYKHKRLIGQLEVVCTQTRLDPRANEGAEQCVVTVTLPRGTLTLQGVLLFAGVEPSGTTLAVTGGTGAYAGAGGEAHVRFLTEKVTKIHFVLN